MGAYAAPALYAVLLWWSATGLVLVLQHLPRRTHPRSLAVASAVLAGALWAIGAVADDETETGAYVGFTAAVIVWSWQEMSYYMGFVSGPKPSARVLANMSSKSLVGSAVRWPYRTPSKRARFELHSAGAMM